ncbi:MAG: FprA family A-type flavoprotein [Clostridia bacterium]|nr:FprA family A-type flavoprotein [Clostridia bacterium]
MHISDSILYVGVNDREIDLFEGQYDVHDGISYNSYVILDEKTAIMDSVDARKTKEWLANVEQALNGRKPDYFVVSHLEPDHGGSLQAAADRYPQMQFIMSAKALGMLPQFGYGELTKRTTAVKENDTLSLGSHTLRFIMAPMVHWPEVMVSYEDSEKVLFSADAFGKFGAVEEEEEDWLSEAREYYINIVGKYGAPVQTLLKKAAALDIQTICPLHGPVLKDNLSYYVGKYQTWSSYTPEEKGTLIAYGTLHGNTAKAARKLAELLKEAGETVEVVDLARDHMSEAVADAFRFDKLVLACPTYDGGIFPKMEDFINHLKAKAYQKRKVAFIENGTWAPMAAKQMKAMMEGWKDVVFCDTTVTIKSTMNAVNEEQMAALVKELLV